MIGILKSLASSFLSFTHFSTDLTKFVNLVQISSSYFPLPTHISIAIGYIKIKIFNNMKL